MNKELSKLYPSPLWENFASICSIPHPSKHEAQIIEWLKKWATDHKVDYVIDKAGNMIFRKPATPGMENRMPIILQGHIDMVPQANSDKKHDFTKDPIEPIIGEDGWIRANGTTLGADNGIGCAAAMAVLTDTQIAHGPIEVLVTIDEETGMTGAFGLEKGVIKGDILMNLDSEDEGELYVGCAGGLDASLELDYQLETTPKQMKGLQVVLTGLRGGHSGMDINLGRGNANKLMARLLKKVMSQFGVRLATLEGGNMRNAIPREAVATAVVPENKYAQLMEYVKIFTQTIQKELSVTEPGLVVKVLDAPLPEKVIAQKDAVTCVNVIFALPNGAMRMSDSMPDLVETSNNLAIVKTENGTLKIYCLMRSSVDSAKEALSDKMSAIAELASARIELSGGYPGWKPNIESPILKTMKKVYADKYGKEPAIKAIHAGLECGLFGATYPHWDMISFGPTIRHPHSPDEKVNIESVGKFWDFLVETLKNIPVKK